MGRTRSGMWYGEDAIRIDRMFQDHENWVWSIVRAFTDRGEYLDLDGMNVLIQVKYAMVCEILREQIGFDHEADYWQTYTSLICNTNGDIMW